MLCCEGSHNLVVRGRWRRKKPGTVGKKNGTGSSTISPKRKRPRIFLQSRYAERSIVPGEPRVPQFGDEGIQEELVLSSQSIAVLHLLRIAELAKERVEYGETLFDRHRFFYR